MSFWASTCSLPPSSSWEPIEKYINEQYEKFLKEEVNIARKKRIPDTRVHCCLYFISPTGHSLKTLDLLTMKSLDSKVGLEKNQWLRFRI